MIDAETRGLGDELRTSGTSGVYFVSPFTVRVSRGFTLLEVMVAVAILSLVLVSLIGLRNRSSQDVLFAEHMTTATLLAKQKMTEALLMKVFLPEEKEGAFENEASKDYQWKRTIAVTPVPAIMEVRVAVLWKEGERDEMVELVSYE